MGSKPSSTGPHIHKNWISTCPGKVIVIDPIKHDTAKMADLHLQPFPGTDAALAYSMLYVISREGLLDEQFINKNVLYWDEVSKIIKECNPEWGEAVTGVPKRLIVEAALLYSKGPSLLWLGQGLQRQRLGGNIIRSCNLLPIATGNIGKLGAGFLFLNGGSTRKIDRDYLVGSQLKKNNSLSISQMEFVDYLENTEKSKMLFCWNNNIVTSNPEQNRLRKALCREDLFTVSIDVFPTDTADYADIVLPAASFMEYNDLHIPYFNLVFSPVVKITEPLGLSLPNQEIFRRLAKKMGFDEPALLEDDETIIATVLKRAGLNIEFHELEKRGTIDFTEEPTIQFSNLKFPTKSGKIELKSEKHGLSQVPQPIFENRPKNGRLRLLSPASPWTMNSSYFNDAKIRKMMGKASVIIHPDEGARRNLEEGIDVSVSNENGKLTL